MPRTKKSDDIDKYVGEQIRRFRMTLGVSQTDIADVLALTFQQVQKYEKGANRIAPGRLAKLAEYFGIDIREFFPPAYSNGGKMKEDPILKLAQTRDGIELALAYLSIPDGASRKAVVEMVVAVAKAITR